MSTAKVIYFDKKSYNQSIQELERYRDLAKQLRELWYSEPLLQDIEFTHQHFTGLVAGGYEYLKQQVHTVVTNQIENTMSKAAALHFNPGVFKTVCEKEMVEDIVNQLRREREDNILADVKAPVSCTMLEIRKTYPYISEQLKASVKNQCSIFDSGFNSKLYKAGVELETAYNKMFDVLKEKYKNPPAVIRKPGEKRTPGVPIRAALRVDLQSSEEKYRFSLDLLEYGLQ